MYISPFLEGGGWFSLKFAIREWVLPDGCDEIVIGLEVDEFPSNNQ